MGVLRTFQGGATSREHLNARDFTRILQLKLQAYRLCLDLMARVIGALTIVGLFALGTDPPHAAQGSTIRFTDVAGSTGLASFLNISGTPSKDFIVETIGNGVALFDYDNDGDLDALLVNGSTRSRQPTASNGGAVSQRRRPVYRRDGGQPASPDLAGESGVCVADYDNDGFQDVYVTAFGPNVLWRNTAWAFVRCHHAGRADPRWSTGCAFGDYDRDGDVDLYVANFVRFVPGKVPKRGHAVKLPLRGHRRVLRPAWPAGRARRAVSQRRKRHVY